MLSAEFLSSVVRLGAAKRPAGGGRQCATLFNVLASADTVRARLRRTLAEEGVSELGFEVLSAMQTRGGEAIPPSVISDACGIFRGTLTDVLARLEASGLIVRRRNQADRRQLLAELTDRGRKVCGTATDRYASAILAMMADLNAATLSMVDQTLAHIRGTADAAKPDLPSSP